MHRLLLLLLIFPLLTGPLLTRTAEASRRTKNLAYVSPSAPDFDRPGHLLDVYAARHPAGAARPIVVFIHGGNWDSGHKGFYAFIGRRLATLGMVGVVPNYRLALKPGEKGAPGAPLVRVPQMALDCARAVAWAQRHAAEFGGDSTRIFVMGHSAGGGLAALLTTTVGDSLFRSIGLKTNPVRGTVLDDPAGLDMYSYLKKMEYPGDHRFLGPFGPTPAVWKNYSAYWHLRPNSPPLLFFVGGKTYPSISSSSEVVRQRAESAGIPATLTLIPGRHHIPMVLQLFWKRNVIYRQLLRLVVGMSVSSPVSP